MKCFVCLLLLLALLGVNAYDFDNSAFNEYLYRELQSIQDDGDLSSFGPKQRTRRDAEVESTTEKNLKECPKPSWKTNIHCCKGSNLNEEELKISHNLKKECGAELKLQPADGAYDPFDCEKMQQVKEQIFCISECMAKKYISLAANGTSTRDIILNYFRKQINDVAWKKEALEGYVDKCMVEVKERREQHEKEGKKIEGCSPWHLALQSCMWRQFWSGCPAELHVDTPRCNKLRGRLAIGNNDFFSQHFLYKYYPMGE